MLGLCHAKQGTHFAAGECLELKHFGFPKSRPKPKNKCTGREEEKIPEAAA